MLPCVMCFDMRDYKVVRNFSTYDSHGKVHGEKGKRLIIGRDLLAATAARLVAGGFIKVIKPRKKAAEE